MGNLHPGLSEKLSESQMHTSVLSLGVMAEMCPPQIYTLKS